MEVNYHDNLLVNKIQFIPKNVVIKSPDTLEHCKEDREARKPKKETQVAASRYQEGCDIVFQIFNSFLSIECRVVRDDSKIIMILCRILIGQH